MSLARFRCTVECLRLSGPVADIYILVLDAILAGKNPGHGREGIYFGENGEHTLYEVAKAIAEALVAQGLSDSPEPTTFSKEDLDKYLEVRVQHHYADRLCLHTLSS